MKPTTLNNKYTLLKVLLTVFPHCVLFLSSCKQVLLLTHLLSLVTNLLSSMYVMGH